MKSPTAILIAAALWTGTAYAADLTFFWRAPGTGLIQSKTVSIPEPVDPGHPEQPQGFRLSFSGAQSVGFATVVDLAPIIKGGVGPYVFTYFGPLPAGVTFNNANGRFSGPALKRGTFAIVVEVLDTGTGQSTATDINLVVS